VEDVTLSVAPSLGIVLLRPAAQSKVPASLLLIGDPEPAGADYPKLAYASRDLALFSSRMDGFFFPGSSTCRTMERLDRRVRQRRDATRAPNQARNGWRPQGRLRGQPASPSKYRQNFVQTMGSTSVFVADPGCCTQHGYHLLRSRMCRYDCQVHERPTRCQRTARRGDGNASEAQKKRNSSATLAKGCSL